MSSRVKTWFLAPSWDLPPGSVQLGGVFSDPSGVHIDKGHALFSPQEADIDSEIVASTKTGFKVTVEELKNRKASIFARFLQAVPVGGEATAEQNKNAREHYQVNKMQTKWFTPTKALEKKAIEAVDVADFLEQSDYEEPEYMIVGVRIAQGMSITTLKKRGSSLRGWFGVDLSAASVPLAVGAEGADETSHSELVTFKGSSEIVFAYQLREIRVSNGRAVGKDFIEGALLGLERVENRHERTVSTQEVDISSFSDAYKKEAIDELDKSDCICIFPDNQE